MANRTDPRALSVHGTNPQNLLEQIVRMRIYSCAYWKEHCFGLTAETLVDKAMELDHYGGTYGGNKKPSKFLCLILKMLQIQPERDIVLEFILNEDYKYVRLLGAFYLRLVGKAKDIYQYLEPLYNDYRKIRKKGDLGWKYSHVDEFIDELLTEEYCLDVVLPRIQKRAVLEEAEELPARKSGLELELEDEDSESDSGEDGEILESKKEKERDQEKEKEKEKEREKKDRDYDKDRSRNHDRDREYRDRNRDGRDRRDRSRSRSHSRERDKDRNRERGKERHREKDTEKDRERDSHDKDYEREHKKDNPDESARVKKKQKVEKSTNPQNDPEVQAENALRAKLGLKPLKYD